MPGPHGSKRSLATMNIGDGSVANEEDIGELRGQPKQRTGALASTVLPERAHQLKGTIGSGTHEADRTEKAMDLDHGIPTDPPANNMPTRDINQPPSEATRKERQQRHIHREAAKIISAAKAFAHGPFQDKILRQVAELLLTELSASTGAAESQTSHMSARNGSGGVGRDGSADKEDEEMVGTDQERVKVVVNAVPPRAPDDGKVSQTTGQGKGKGRALDDIANQVDATPAEGSKDAQATRENVADVSGAGSVKPAWVSSLEENLERLKAEEMEARIELLRVHRARSRPHVPLSEMVQKKILGLQAVLYNHCMDNAHPDVFAEEIAVKLNQLLDPVARGTEPSYEFVSTQDQRKKLREQLRTHILAKANNRNSLFFANMTFDSEVIQQLAKAAADPDHLLLGRRDVIGPVVIGDGQNAGNVAMKIYHGKVIPDEMKGVEPPRKKRKTDIAPALAQRVEQFEGGGEPSRSGLKKQ